MDYEALGRLAERWVLLEAARKLRRSERNVAFAILVHALKCPVLHHPETDRAVFAPQTDEQRELHDHAMRVGRAYDEAHPKARATRAAMTRMVKAANLMPEPDPDLRAACKAACKAACEVANERDDGMEFA